MAEGEFPEPKKKAADQPPSVMITLIVCLTLLLGGVCWLLGKVVG